MSPLLTRISWRAHNDAVLSYLDVVSDGRSFNHRVGSDVNMVADFHRVVIEGAAVGLVWGSLQNQHRFKRQGCCFIPHDTSFAH